MHKTYVSAPSIYIEYEELGVDYFDKLDKEQATRQLVKRLEQLGTDAPVDRTIMHRRQAKALTRITVVETLNKLVSAGVISQAVADAAATRVCGEVDQAGT